VLPSTPAPTRRAAAAPIVSRRRWRAWASRYWRAAPPPWPASCRWVRHAQREAQNP